MPRFKIASRLALVGSLALPSFASGQSVEPPVPPAQIADVKPNEPKTVPSTNPLDPPMMRFYRLEDLVPAPSARLYDPFALSSWSLATMSAGANKPAEWKHPTDNPLLNSYGIELAEADDALRSQLEIPAGQGVVVVNVKPASLAEHAGLKPNDVLMALGDEKAANVKDASKVLLNLGRKALEVKLIREGKPSRMSLVGPDHGFPPEAAGYWIGVPVSPVDAVLRTHLPALNADAGLIANDVVKGSPAAKAGLQKNDILATMNGKPLKNSDSLIEQIQAAEGKPIPVEIFRAGKPITVTVTPEKRTHPTTIKLYNRPNEPHYLQREYHVVSPYVGIEVDPKEPGVRSRDQLTTAYGNYVRQLTEKPIDIQLQLQQVNPKAGEAGTARIEAQLKEVSSKLDAILKAIEQVNGSAKK